MLVNPNVFFQWLLHRIVHPGSILQDPRKFDLVETFAGKAEVTRMFREGNLRAAKLDLLYMQPEHGRDNPMDLTTDAGFVNLVSSYVQYPFVVKTWQLVSLFLLLTSNPLILNLYILSSVTLSPRTALSMMMRGDYEKGWLSLWALKCSSFTSVNSGTSSRSACTAIGNCEYSSVRNGNCLGSRILV